MKKYSQHKVLAALTSSPDDLACGWLTTWVSTVGPVGFGVGTRDYSTKWIFWGRDMDAHVTLSWTVTSMNVHRAECSRDATGGRS